MSREIKHIQMTARERGVAKFDESLRESEGDFRHLVNFSCNISESAFASKAKAKGLRIWRAGWPDFLVEGPDGFFAVEVKKAGDSIRSIQKRMFEALESAGIRVLIFDPAMPDVLIPWRTYHRKRRIRAQAEAVESQRRYVQAKDGRKNWKGHRQ
jgi:hypothetical protein